MRRSTPTPSPLWCPAPRGLLHEEKPALWNTVIAEFLTTALASIMGTRAPRLPYLDRLKVLLVALITVWHGDAGYTDLESAWPYRDVQEVGLAELSNNLLATLACPGFCSRWAASS